MKKIVLIGGILLSAALGWFSVSYYQSAGPIAEENLRGLALSLTSAVENIALHDPSLRDLGTFQAHEIAFFALIDQNGMYRFHSNPDLIGTHLQGTVPFAELREGTISSQRTTLRTGERAFEFNAPLRLHGEKLTLRLTLHTYRADTVIRRARLNMIVLFALLVAGWLLALALYRFTRREELLRMKMAHRESLAQLGEMGAMLAHEIRNPLAGIKGFAQVIEKKPQDERNPGFARRIVTETLRLETLVNELLSFAKDDLETMAPLNLVEVVSHSAELLRQEAEQLQIKIVCESPETILIKGNRDRLTQLLLNVVKNALQAMPDGGVVRIKTVVEGGRAIIKVSDTGEGITGEDLPRVFEPFFTTKAKGTGLGLALCRKIAEEHRGTITVETFIGEDTTVSITIPIDQNRHRRS